MNSNIFLTIFLFFYLTLFSFSSPLPSFITINKDGGISLRQFEDPKSDAIGAVYNGYTYKVTDGKRSYVKVKTSNGLLGWAWVGQNDERFEYLGDKIKSNVSYNIPVQLGDEKSLIQPNELVDLVDIWHSRLKVKTPDNKHGWMYAGKYNDPWVTFVGQPLSEDSIYANFESDTIESNALISSKKVQFFTQNESYRFISAKESEVGLDFDLTYDLMSENHRNKLQITHMVAEKNPTDTSISIYINNIKFLERYRPVYNKFDTDVFHIGHLLKPGPNKIIVRLDRSNTSYFLKSLKIIK